MVTLARPRRRAAPSMNVRWLAEFEDADDACCAGKRAASSRASDPQPQPSSRMRMPSSMPACAMVQIQRRDLRRLQRADAVAPPGAAVLEPRAKDALEERRRHLVVLGVGSDPVPARCRRAPARGLSRRWRPRRFGCRGAGARRAAAARTPAGCPSAAPGPAASRPRQDRSRHRARSSPCRLLRIGLRRPRHEGARGALVGAIGVAAAAERLRLGGRDAGDACDGVAHRRRRRPAAATRAASARARAT